jgi:hypothetical protein
VLEADLGTVRLRVPCGGDRNCNHAALDKQANLLDLHPMCFQQLAIPFEIHECEVRVRRNCAHRLARIPRLRTDVTIEAQHTAIQVSRDLARHCRNSQVMRNQNMGDRELSICLDAAVVPHSLQLRLGNRGPARCGAGVYQ